MDLQTLLALYNALPSWVWVAATGGAVSLFVTINKRLFGVNDKFVIHLLTATTSFVIAVFPTLTALHPESLGISAKFAASFFVWANFIYVIASKVRPFLDKVNASPAEQDMTIKAPPLAQVEQKTNNSATVDDDF